MAPKKLTSLSDALARVAQFKQSCIRTCSLYGYESEDIPKRFARLLTMSNSLAIVLLQYELLHGAFDLLKTAAEAGRRLRDDWSAEVSTGRAVTFSCLAHLFEKY